jgi:large subunit ribosomal protein L31e
MEEEKEEEKKEEEKTEEPSAELEETTEEVAEAPEKTEEPTEKEPIEETTAVEEEKPSEEEAKPSEREEKKKKEEEEIVEERIYTIPLSRAWIMPPNKRAPRAIRIIKAFIIKHMKMEAKKEEGEEEEEPARLIIDAGLNEKVWGKGIQKPPRNVRVKAAKDKDGNITLSLAEGD